MKIKPILFNPDVAEAVLEGRKTQTRGIIKLPVVENKSWDGGAYIEHRNGDRTAVACEDLPSKYKKGDILWLKNIWANSSTIVFLEVTEVRAERLQDISDEDAIAEGVKLTPGLSKLPRAIQAQINFQNLWKSINGADSWEANPWVWVYTFKRTERPANF